MMYVCICSCYMHIFSFAIIILVYLSCCFSLFVFILVQYWLILPHSSLRFFSTRQTNHFVMITVGVHCVDKLGDLGITYSHFLEYKDNPVRPEYLFTNCSSKKTYLPSRSIAGLVHNRVQTREREMNEEDCSYLETEMEGDADYIYVGDRDTERYRSYYECWTQYCEVLCN